MRFVDCNGLGGAMALGFRQNGNELVHKTGSLSLGRDLVLANRPLLGWEWEYEVSNDPRDWHVPDDVDVVVGSPPCSGFSTMTRKDLRGVDADVNVHIHNFVDYVARVRPTIAAFESVQQAYSTGLPLMKEIHQRLREKTGLNYQLTHLLHNGLSVGGPANRPRYFWVASLVPFGVEHPEPDTVPVFRDVLGDLQGMAETWEKQAYRRPATWWSSRRRSPDETVDGHMTRRKMSWTRIGELMDGLDGDWPQGMKTEEAARRVYERHGTLPPSWKSQEDKLIANGFSMGINQPVRWSYDRPCHVITGSALEVTIHPVENRLITFREAFRIQGFPDNWQLWPVRDMASLARVPGKGVPVDASRWLGYWVNKALEGEPGTMQGRPTGDNEFELRVDRGFKRAQRRGTRRHHEFWAK